MAEDRKKVSSEQLSILIEELEKDSTLLTGKGSTNLLYVAKWEALARKLNSVENGALKNVTKWQQAWRDWKSNTKKKAVKRALSGTPELTSLESKVLSMCDDQPDVKHSGIDISGIEKMEPLPSDDSSDSEDMSRSPELLTVYTSHLKENGKRSRSDDAERVRRKRSKMFPDDNNDKLTDIVSRLVTMEALRLETESQQTKLLQDIATSMERQAEAAETQANALTRIVELLERRDKDG